jgi:hypothetical protein
MEAPTVSPDGERRPVGVGHHPQRVIVVAARVQPGAVQPPVLEAAVAPRLHEEAIGRVVLRHHLLEVGGDLQTIKTGDTISRNVG